MPETQPPLHIGDHVVDTEDEDGATLLVVGRSPQPANHYSINGEQTVADYNAEYPSDDDVVEVIFPERSDVDVSSRQAYAYPRSRLELVAAVHDRSEGEGEVTMLSGDSEIVECVCCGATGIKARIQPTACPHDTLDDDRESVVSVTTGPGDINAGEDA